MHVLVTGAAGFIGMHAASALLAQRRARDRRRQLRSLLRRLAQGGARRHARGTPGFAFERVDLADADADRAAVSRRRASPTSCILPRSRACGTRSRIPTRTCATTSSRSGTCSKAAGTRASRHLVYASSSSVYGASHDAAVLRGPARRPSGEPVRRDQVRERADGVQLRASVRPAGDRPALLHRVRPVGTARPGADAVHQGDPGRRADQRLQRRHACERDFTYVDDIVEGVVRMLRAAAVPARRPPRSTTSATTKPCR